MRFLIIDNDTSYLPQIKELLSDHSSRVVDNSEIDTINPDEFDVIILSGSHDFPVKGNEELLQDEMNLVLNCKKPIFGICFGFQVIARAFGADLELMENREEGMLDIKVMEQDKVFNGISNFRVFENHRWVVKEVPDELIPLACSKDGIEVIKHRSKPIYAVQFHPELFVEKSCGDEIFNNFLGLVK